MKDSRGPGGDPRRGAAESEPRVTLSMGRRILEIPEENEGFQRSWGGDSRRGAAESEPRVALSMGRKIIEILWENEGFQNSWGVVHGAAPQNLSLEWPSVWGRKSLKFLGKGGRREEEGGRRTGCIQNENPHIGEWWE